MPLLFSGIPAKLSKKKTFSMKVLKPRNKKHSLSSTSMRLPIPIQSTSILKNTSEDFHSIPKGWICLRKEVLRKIQTMVWFKAHSIFLHPKVPLNLKNLDSILTMSYPSFQLLRATLRTLLPLISAAKWR
jgi:hypothetical protein